MDDKDLDSRTERSHSRSRRKFLYAVGGGGIVSAAGLALMGVLRSATKIDHNIAANGPVVMTERLDVFKLPDKSFELPVMGTFEVSDGKISAWRDYFDMNQFTSRMG